MTRPKHRILVVSNDADDYVQRLQQAALDQAELLAATNVAQGQALVGDCAIVMGNPSMVAEILPRATKLTWVQSTFAGVEPLCRPGLRRDYRLTGVKDVFGPLMSEYVFLHILAHERQLAATWQVQADRLWQPMAYRGLGGRVMGICGLGSIGRHIAATGRHFGMRVVGYRRSSGDCDGVDQVYSGDQLHAFLAEPDYLVLALPQTAATHHLIDADALARLRPDATVINVGRGDAIDEAALANALQAGHLRHAVLDVFEHEPLPASSPLWRLPNVTLTPHNAARSFPADIVRLFLTNYERYCRGETLEHLVDFERGY